MQDSLFEDFLSFLKFQGIEHKRSKNTITLSIKKLTVHVEFENSSTRLIIEDERFDYSKYPKNKILDFCKKFNYEFSRPYCFKKNLPIVLDIQDVYDKLNTYTEDFYKMKPGLKKTLEEFGSNVSKHFMDKNAEIPIKYSWNLSGYNLAMKIDRDFCEKILDDVSDDSFEEFMACIQFIGHLFVKIQIFLIKSDDLTMELIDESEVENNLEAIKWYLKEKRIQMVGSKRNLNPSVGDPSFDDINRPTDPPYK
jgi:hypothetical protein